MTTLQTLPTITAKEALLLKGVAKSDYQDGDMIGKQVWSWSATDHLENKKGAGALVASLVRKGLLTHSPKSGDEDECIAFTKLGVEVYRAAYPEPTPEPTPAPVELSPEPTKPEGKVKMTGISNNPARVALLTEMAEQTDGGAKVWEEQPATRNGTKNALLRDGYVSIAKGGKASITGKGREAVTAHTLKAMSAPVALEAATPTNGEEAKAKFEAARAEVVKPAKAKTDTRFTKAAKAKAVEDTRKLAAQPAANPPEQKAGPVQKAEQPAEQPAPVADEQPEMDPTDPRGSKLARIILDIYGVNFLEAPALALIWAASQLADLEGVEAAKMELSYCNWRRERAGKFPALPPYGSKLF